ncbi:MAG TPA: hypothetical protein PLM09_12605, partial [Casimicrobiaceae bacterium]|nr:hypothetical protein [Casimicrobiaceae bacterium]
MPRVRTAAGVAAAGGPPSGANARVLAQFDEHLASRPARTRDAYARDVATLAALAGERPLS